MTPASFLLPPEDTEYLDMNFPNWEPVEENSKNGIVIPKYELPKGYCPNTSNLMIIIPPNYPTANIDMFYFCPPVEREDRVTIEALNLENHFGIQWQRWSRHYEWRPGIDGVHTHIPYVHNQLEYELRNNK